MNDSEIDQTIHILERNAPDIAPYAKFLGDWRDIVNANSDGWAYWSAGAKAADKLSQLLQKAVDVVRGREEDMPIKRDLDASLSSIRALATRKNLPKPELDVAAPNGGPRR